MSTTRSKMGASIQGCANAAGVPEGWPVSVVTQPGESVSVTLAGGGSMNVQGVVSDGTPVGATNPILIGTQDDDGDARLLRTYDSAALNAGIPAADADRVLPTIPLARVASSGLLVPWTTPATDAINHANMAQIAQGIVNAAGTLDRTRTADGANGTTGTGLLGAGILIRDSSNYVRVLSERAQGADGQAGAQWQTSSLREYNETNYDRRRNNTNVTGLASGARTTTQTITGINYNGRGISVVLDMTAIGAGATWTVSIDIQDAASGVFVNLLTGAAVGGNGTTMYRVYPGLTPVANVDANAFVQRNYRVVITVGGTAASSTFSVGIQTQL